MVRNWVVEEVVDFGWGHDGWEGYDRSSSLLSPVRGVRVRFGECACSSLESLRCNNDALVGSEVEASRITVAFLINIHLVFSVLYIDCGCCLIVHTLAAFHLI